MELQDVVNQFIIDCEIRGLTPTTIEWYQKHLTFFIKRMVVLSGVTQLEQVRIVHLRQVVQSLMNNKTGENNPRTPTKDKPLSAYTVRGYVRAVKVFFGWCADEELITNDPSARLFQPKAPEYLIPTFTVEHIEAMLNTSVCNISKPEGFRNYVLLLVLLDTGMRVSELCGLRVGDIHDRYVRVFGKGRKEREIGLHPEVAKLVWKYIHVYRKPARPDDDTLFIGHRGEPLRYQGIQAMLDEVKKESGISEVRVSAHTFRHTFAKFYLQRGGEVFKLSREMGHSTVQVTEIYLKDYRSSEARREHTNYSPIGQVQLPNKKRGRRKEKK